MSYEGNGWGADADYYHNRIPIVATNPPHSNPIADAMEYLDGKVKGFQPPMDQDDVIRLTRGMKREHWQAPMNTRPEERIMAFLRHFGSAWLEDLERLGASESMLRRLIAFGKIRKEYFKRVRSTGYFLA
jgi:hypothetical protein